MKTTKKILMAVPAFALAIGGAALAGTQFAAAEPPESVPGYSQQAGEVVQVQTRTQAQIHNQVQAENPVATQTQAQTRTQAQSGEQVQVQQREQARVMEQAQTKSADTTVTTGDQDRDRIQAMDGTGADQQRDRVQDQLKDGSCQE
jgi:hypothetical protein